MGAGPALGSCGQEGAAAEPELLAVVRGVGLAYKRCPWATGHTAAGNNAPQSRWERVRDEQVLDPPDLAGPSV